MAIDRRTFLVLSATAVATPVFAAANANAGRIETLTPFGPDQDTAMRVRLFLPPGYDATDRLHQTLYLLDGQYAFSADSNGINFGADQRVARLMAAGTIPPTVVVAIDNLEDNRFVQYMPQSIYDRANREVRATVERDLARVGADSLVSGDFIRFLEDRLKPYIDKRYHTSSDRIDTAIFGASMAGVMSGAILVEAQDSFGRCACMSPNWAIYDERFIDHESLPTLWSEYFSQLGAPDGRRLWLDHGTEMMDAGMRPHQVAIAGSLADLGWRRGCNLQTRIYEAGHAFAETAVQMDEVLAWLLA